ncbi:MAG: hypothetical protein SV775_14915 [Thermodesulfobacteriota bacterium]|nr:hypothetical protein [Thermodesulfobacteriota bacterium]
MRHRADCGHGFIKNDFSSAQNAGKKTLTVVGVVKGESLQIENGFKARKIRLSEGLRAETAWWEV